MKQLFVAALATFSFGVAKADLGQLVGFYKLSSARAGLCELEKIAYTSRGLDGRTWEIWVGEHDFVEPVGKRVGFEDRISRDVIFSDLRGNTLVRTTRSEDRINGGTTSWTVKVTWTGSRMRVRSSTHGDPASLRDCAYRKVSNKAFAPERDGARDVPRRYFEL